MSVETYAKDPTLGNPTPESEGIIIVILYLQNQSASKQLDCTVKL